MTPGEFRSQILTHHMDGDELVTVDRDPGGKWSGGNELLNTGLFCTILSLKGELQDEDRVRFERAVRRCQVVPGVFNRNPERPDWEAHDDYVGVAAGGFFTRTPVAGEIYRFGDVHSWCFDNRSPGARSLEAWHGRFPGRVCFYTAAAGISPRLPERLLFNSGIRGAAVSRDPGQQVLWWLQSRVALQAGVCPMAIGEWEEAVRDRLGGIQGVLRAVYGEAHPFSRINL